MPDSFDSDGLKTKQLPEITEELEVSLRGIYGEDINVNQNSQDGQTLNIYGQGSVDTRELLQQINASFDPDQASGRVLDQRLAINGIKRNGGTYTFAPIEITADRALNLIGLDSQSNELNPTVSGLYTVKDDAGTEFYLLSSVSFLLAETQELTFRAKEIGSVEIQVNTITSPVTVIAGITGINNPSGALSIGDNEESDSQAKVRRKSSVALPALGYLDAIEANLNNLDGVSIALVYENDTDTTDSDGTPGHHIWAIIEGGDDTEIGEILYKKKSYGAGMRGAVVVNIPRTRGRTYPAKFDRPGSEDLWIKFTVSLIGGGVIDTEALKEEIVEGIQWEIGGDAGGDDISTFIKDIHPDYRVTGMEVSTDNITYSEVSLISSPQNRFLNSVTRIAIS